jgi:hypothetical protein
MSLPNLTFIKGQGGLGRPLPSNDHISGMLFYTANGNLPSGWTTSAREKALYSVQDAVNAGISGTYADATAATATFLITTGGSTGDTITIKVADLDATGTAQSTTLCTYTKVAGDATIASLGSSITAAINAGTVNHGYTASFSIATLTITAPKKFGVYLNTGTPYTATITGTMAGTWTQNVVAGVASLQAVWHYHISEFFRIQPKGVLYVGFYAVPSPYTYTEISSLQNYAQGAIRQIAVYKDAAAIAAGDVTAIDAVCKTLDDAGKNISAIIGGHTTGVPDLSAIFTLNDLTDEKCSMVLAQDGGAHGNFLYITCGKSISALGACLGTIALAKVSESIAWVEKFNMSNGTELEVLAFSNGTKFSNSAVTDGLLEALNDKRFIFLKKHVGLSGSYWNDSHTAVVPTSDYAYIENNRTIDKAIRNLRAAYLPKLNSPITLNADGTMSDNTITMLENIGDAALDQMLRDFELSARRVQISPTQDVLATSKLVIGVDLVVNGVARFIEIPIGFKPSIA